MATVLIHPFRSYSGILNFHFFFADVGLEGRGSLVRLRGSPSHRHRRGLQQEDFKRRKTRRKWWRWGQKTRPQNESLSAGESTKFLTSVNKLARFVLP